MPSTSAMLGQLYPSLGRRAHADEKRNQGETYLVAGRVTRRSGGA